MRNDRLRKIELQKSLLEDEKKKIQAQLIQDEYDKAIKSIMDVKEELTEGLVKLHLRDTVSKIFDILEIKDSHLI